MFNSTFSKSVFYCIYVKNTFMKIWKSESNSVYDNIPYKYKNIFNINKWLKRTFITKRKYYNKLNFFIKIHTYVHTYIYVYIYINIYIIKKNHKIIFMILKVEIM